MTVWTDLLPELPHGWEMTTIGEIADTKLGKMLSRKSKTGNDEQPYLRNQNVQWGHFELNDLATMEFTAEERSKFSLSPGDIVVCEGGEVGRAAVWRGPDGIYFQKALHRLRCCDGVLPEFVAHGLRCMAESHMLETYTSGSTISHLPQEDLRQLPLPLPPRREQERIVLEVERRLSHVGASTRSVDLAMTKLASARRSLLETVVRGTLLGGDSSCWDPVSAGEVTDVQGGIQKQPKRRPVANSYPFLRVANIGRGVLDLETVHRIELFGDELATYALQRGDLLVVEGNGSVGQIGRAALWDGSIPDCVHQNHLIRVRPRAGLLPEFLAFMWNAPSTIEQLKRVASSTSGLHTLSTGKVKAIQFRVPDEPTQQALIDEVERRLSLLEAAARSSSRARSGTGQLRRSILVAALTGKLVPQDPSDEPASVLLDRSRPTLTTQKLGKPNSRKVKETAR